MSCDPPGVTDLGGPGPTGNLSHDPAACRRPRPPGDPTPSGRVRAGVALDERAVTLGRPWRGFGATSGCERGWSGATMRQCCPVDDRCRRLAVDPCPADAPPPPRPARRGGRKPRECQEAWHRVASARSPRRDTQARGAGRRGSGRWHRSSPSGDRPPAPPRAQRYQRQLHGGSGHRGATGAGHPPQQRPAFLGRDRGASDQQHNGGSPEQKAASTRPRWHHAHRAVQRLLVRHIAARANGMRGG